MTQPAQPALFQVPAEVRICGWEMGGDHKEDAYPEGETMLAVVVPNWFVSGESLRSMGQLDFRRRLAEALLEGIDE